MKRWLIDMSRKFERFMRYRYGNDQLNNFLMFIYLILLMIQWISKTEIVTIVSYTIMVMVGFVVIYRFFSKKKIQRSKENHHYLNIKYNIKGFFRRFTKKARNRSTYKYFKCPHCHQELRVPRGRGKVSVTCPKCHTVFDEKT